MAWDRRIWRIEPEGFTAVVRSTGVRWEDGDRLVVGQICLGDVVDVYVTRYEAMIFSEKKMKT
jgi:hypothetical protein